MIHVTLSEDGLTAGTDGSTECHTAERVDPSRVYGSRSASIVRLTLTREQAIDLLDDIRSQIDYRDDEQVEYVTPGGHLTLEGAARLLGERV